MLSPRKISICTIGLSLTTAFHTAAEVGFASLVEVQQQVGLEVGYRMDGVDHILVSDLDPSIPQGRSDANLKVSTTRYGASGSATLNSRFRDDRFAVKGLAGVSAAWRNPPQGAQGMHTGSATTFLARFETGSVPALFRCDGSIGVGLANVHSPHSGQMSVHIRLVAGSGSPLWQQELDGADKERLKAVSFSETLMPNQEYRFALYAEAKALSGQEREEMRFCAAWFDLDAEIADAPATNVSESRALLVTVTPELEVLEIDGRQIDPFQTRDRHGFREHSVPVGEHAITLSFRRVVPITYDSIESLRGSPLNLTHFFLSGHKYMLLHRAHTNREPEGMDAAEKIMSHVPRPSHSHWSAKVIDLADVRHWLASTHLDRADSPDSDEARRADKDREATIESHAAQGTRRLGLTPEEISAVTHYLTLEDEEAAMGQAGAHSEK